MAKESIRYDPAVHPRQAQLMCQNGAVDREICEMFDIPPSTFYRWRNEHPEFAQALCDGKDVADTRVERALYNRAVGYSFNSEKLVTVSVGGNQGSVVERHEIVEHVPPDVKAAVRWLESRKPEKWRRTLAMTGPNGGPLQVADSDANFDGLDENERADLRKLLAKAAASPEPGAG